MLKTPASTLIHPRPTRGPWTIYFLFEGVDGLPPLEGVAGRLGGAERDGVASRLREGVPGVGVPGRL